MKITSKSGSDTEPEGTTWRWIPIPDTTQISGGAGQVPGTEASRSNGLQPTSSLSVSTKLLHPLWE